MTAQRVRFAPQAGRTLIELVIAMALSLVIVAAVGSLYYFTSQSSRQSQQTSSAEERGRLAMYLLSEPITMAGYGTIRNPDTAVRFGVTPMPGPHLRGCTNSRFNDPMNLDFTCVPSNAPGDELFVAFQGESDLQVAPQGTTPIVDCVGGQPVLMGGVPMVRNSYRLQTMGSGAIEFTCGGSSGGGLQQLVRDVEDFKVYFAFDSAAYNAAGTSDMLAVRPSEYMTAAQINAMPALPGAGDPWNHVIAVLVCLQIRSAESGMSPDGLTRFRPCPQNEVEAANGTAEVTLNDGFSRRTVSQLFTLRARVQALPGL